MPRARHIAGLALIVGAAMAIAGVFADWPVYRHRDEGEAVIKVSFDHQGARIAPCRALSEEELAALPAHKRTGQDCPRGRVPVTIEVAMDGRPLYAATEAPSGWAEDGPSRVFGQAVVSAGAHDLVLRLRDTARADGFDHEKALTVTIAPAQVLVIGFDSENAAFVIR
ncbi:MAG: hypothetical protein FJX36_12375 [Alphaproteobacteria bacterium]|nr:hypothetical protein [Alphaproteobacteria bacterium]